MGPYEILRRYFLEHERQMIPIEVHGDAVSGHYAGKYTT